MIVLSTTLVSLSWSYAACDGDCSDDSSQTWTAFSVTPASSCLTLVHELASGGSVYGECSTALQDGSTRVANIRVDVSSTCDGIVTIAFEDLAEGCTTTPTATNGDFLLQASDGTPVTGTVCLDLVKARVAGTNTFRIPATIQQGQDEVEVTLEASYTE